MKLKYFFQENYTSIKHLDIGCGMKIKNPYGAKNLYGIDVHDNLEKIKNYKKANLILEKLPYPDNFFCSISAYDVLEHIPRQMYIEGRIQYPFINLMSEIYRVLKPNGNFFSCTPYYPKNAAFVDPTHVNFITYGTISYFVDNNVIGKMYGFDGSFKKINIHKINPKFLDKTYGNIFSMYSSWLNGKLRGRFSHLIWELQAVK